MPRYLLSLLVLAVGLSARAAAAESPANPVIIVVMDGLRPDSVVASDMPNLTRLAAAGTFFTNHHPVFLSLTEVNGTALATGMNPSRSGVMGNVEYRPEIDPLFPVEMESEWASWNGDQGSDRWIDIPTLPELLRQQGWRTALAGTKGVALLWDRQREGRSPDSPTIFGGDAIPGAVEDELVAALGPLPPDRDRRYFVNRAQDRWTTEALLEVIAQGADLPALSVLWLSEPDYAQHGVGPGSSLAREALRSSDDCLGLLLDALEASGRRAQTNLLVVSDHGFSTIAQTVDVISDLNNGGIRAGGAFLNPPTPGTVVAVSLGGAVNFYVVGRERAAIERLVNHLQGTAYAGVLFTRDALPGTFSLAQAGLDGEDAPDVVLSMRWAATAPGGGRMPGLLFNSATSYSPGQGMHGSLSSFDMHGTLIAAGPAFRAGFRSETPSSNRDVAPTVLRVLGVDPPADMEGRVLDEALAGGGGPPAVETETLRASTERGGQAWRQYIRLSRVGSHVYLTEGNAGEAPGAP